MIEYKVNPASLRQAREWTPIPGESNHRHLDVARFVQLGDANHPWNRERATGQTIEPEENPCTLGLHWRFVRGQGPVIAPSHFCGVVWLDDKHPLVVLPKVQDMDIAGMLTEVLAASPSVTGLEPEMLFGCDPTAKPITGIKYPDLTILEVITYLATLARFVQRYLRQGFNRVSENLVGRVRGRIKLAEQLRVNHFRGRDDRAYCEFSVMNYDTLENRLLKAAMNACSHWLSRPSLSCSMTDKLARWLCQTRAAFASVPDYQPLARDWASVRTTGLMRAYAEPLALARLILKRIHVDASGVVLPQNHDTFPFFIDMNRLFEGWVGVCFSEIGRKTNAQNEVLLPGFPQKFRFRPDFVIDQQHVVDAKYKIIASVGVDNSDVYQVISYARLLVLNKNGKSDVSGLQEAWLAVPDCSSKGNVNDAFLAFKNRWPTNSYTWEWPDLIFGRVDIPLPIKV